MLWLLREILFGHILVILVFFDTLFLFGNTSEFLVQHSKFSQDLGDLVDILLIVNLLRVVQHLTCELLLELARQVLLFLVCVGADHRCYLIMEPVDGLALALLVG